MSEKKITTTREEIKEIVTGVIENSFAGEKFKNAVENIFEGQRFKDSVEDVVKDQLAKFNVNFLEPMEKELKQEIRQSEGNNKDWTDKRVRQSEGRIAQKLHTLTSILARKRILSEEEASSMHKVGAIG